ncbi:MAG TPA: putative Ig domain-containing protein [Terriglobia bacterium]
MANRNPKAKMFALTILCVVVLGSASTRILSQTAITIITDNLHLGYLQQPYNAILTASGGTPPYTWKITSGSLPSGLSLNSGTGQISGTATRSGTFVLTLTATDKNNRSALRSLTLTIFGYALDAYGGFVNLRCSDGVESRFYVQKIGSRWHFCTPAGNAFWLNGVDDVSQSSGADYQGINNYTLTIAKYSTGLTTSGTLNWAYQSLLRLQAWGFNATGEYSSVYVCPTTVDSRWPTPDQTVPLHLPYTLQLLPTMYSSYNLNGYAPGPTKNTLGAYKQSVFSGYMRGMADVFDPNFSAWLQGNLAKSSAMQSALTGPNNSYLLVVEGDESDTLGGFGPGTDFETVDNGKLDTGYGHADAHWGWMTLITSPLEAATPASLTPESRSPHDVVFSNPKFYSKDELGTWVQQKADRGPGYASISALNAAWGSNYDSFGSDAVSHAQTIGTGNGTTRTYSFTLSHQPVTPLSITLSVGGVVTAGDDGSGPRASKPSSTGNLRGKTSTTALGTVTYSTGAGSITLQTAPKSGASITVTYQTNGWGAGHGLLDEDGTCPSKLTGAACWVPTDAYGLVGASAAMQNDLDGFLFHFAKTYFATVKGDVEGVAPAALYSPVDPVGGWGAPPRRQILQAAAPYADVLALGSLPPTDPNHVVTDTQARIDFVAEYAGDKPWFNFQAYQAPPDSYMSPYSSDPLFTTQVARGAYYQTAITGMVNTETTAGNYPVVGLLWWQHYDSWPERANWGLATLRDDPYDGISATTTAGADSWGYPTGCLATFGCEWGSYGDFVDSVTGANLSALDSIAAGQ